MSLSKIVRNANDLEYCIPEKFINPTLEDFEEAFAACKESLEARTERVEANRTPHFEEFLKECVQNGMWKGLRTIELY